MESMVREALEAIWAGATPDSQEHQHLDFKEDPARVAKPGGNPDAKRVEVMLDAAICFANADGASYVVLGLRDKVHGPEAFTGTDANPEDLRRKIFNGTHPNLTVDVDIERFHDIPLLIMRVPQGLALYQRHGGGATIRRGTSCIPLNEEERQELSFVRRNPDATAHPSRLSVADLDTLALSEGIQRFNTLHSGDPVSTAADLVRRLGLVNDSGTLLMAGELLFAHPRGISFCANHLWRTVPGAEPERNDIDPPLVLAIPQMLSRIAAHSNAEISRVDLPNGQERPIRDFPTKAVEEVILNAFVHRDWDINRSIIVEQSPRVLRVTSPGGLPAGVDGNKLLTTPSKPRNGVLMHALRGLGLVEETSRGFDRMWNAMLTSGRPVPTIELSDYDVSVTFVASEVDPHFVQALVPLTQLLGDNAAHLNTLLVFKELTHVSVITDATAAPLLQVDKSEAREILQWLESIGLIQSQGQDLWSLSTQARDILTQVHASVPQEGDVQAWILDAVAAGNGLTNRQIATGTHAPSRVVTQILRHLATLGLIEKDPAGPTRGPAVRWIATHRTP